jgi:hypothetical protein
VVFSDHRDYDALADLFTEDGVYARPTAPDAPISGREVIRAAYHARPRGKISRHITSNAVVEVQSATEATGFSYVVLYNAVETEGVAKADPVQLIGAFRDRFALVDGAWKIKERIGSLAISIGG